MPTAARRARATQKDTAAKTAAEEPKTEQPETGTPTEEPRAEEPKAEPQPSAETAAAIAEAKKNGLCAHWHPRAKAEDGGVVESHCGLKADHTGDHRSVIQLARRKATVAAKADPAKTAKAEERRAAKIERLRAEAAALGFTLTPAEEPNADESAAAPAA